MKEVPVKAVTSLLVVNTARLGAKAVPIEPTVMTNMAVLYAMRLLLSSAIGDHIKDEQPMARRTPAFVMFSISTVVLSSFEISGVAMRREVDVDVTTRVFHETIKRTT